MAVLGALLWSMVHLHLPCFGELILWLSRSGNLKWSWWITWEPAIVCKDGGGQSYILVPACRSTLISSSMFLKMPCLKKRVSLLIPTNKGCTQWRWCRLAHASVSFLASQCLAHGAKDPMVTDGECLRSEPMSKGLGLIAREKFHYCLQESYHLAWHLTCCAGLCWIRPSRLLREMIIAWRVPLTYLGMWSCLQHWCMTSAQPNSFEKAARWQYVSDPKSRQCEEDTGICVYT